MEQLKCDSKGRLYLKESLRKRYGERFVVVPSTGEILLIPIPKNPVQDLREATKKIRGMSLEQLKALIEKQARKQVVS